MIQGIMSDQEEESASWEWNEELTFDAFLVFLVFLGSTFHLTNENQNFEYFHPQNTDMINIKYKC